MTQALRLRNVVHTRDRQMVNKKEHFYTCLTYTGSIRHISRERKAGKPWAAVNKYRMDLWPVHSV